MIYKENNNYQNLHLDRKQGYMTWKQLLIWLATIDLENSVLVTLDKQWPTKKHVIHSGLSQLYRLRPLLQGRYWHTYAQKMFFFTFYTILPKSSKWWCISMKFIYDFYLQNNTIAQQGSTFALNKIINHAVDQKTTWNYIS